MTREDTELTKRLIAAEERGLTFAVWADVQPDRTAVVDPDGSCKTFAEANGNANRIVRLLRHSGLVEGDAVALVCSNRSEFIEVVAATMRAGWRITPVNWHMTAQETSYIVSDCEAKAFFIDARLGEAAVPTVQSADSLVRIAIGGDLPGCIGYDEALASFSGSEIADPTVGNLMFYTSGTTGRPKGVLRRAPLIQMPDYYESRSYDRLTSVQMCVGPAYHAAPFQSDVRSAMGVGIPLIFLDRWDSANTLKTIAARRVTHMHMVPIMFQRLLALSDEVRAKYDVSHTVSVLHGAAPCPPDVKRAMIAWFGPVLDEYYGASEGGAGFFIRSPEWLEKPGSVGKRPTLLGAKAIDEHGVECPPCVEGLIYQQMPAGGGFSYFKDEEKTSSTRIDDYFTVGDIGYFDNDEYLFLTGRSAETIISGGVNIYPSEIDNILVTHEAVADSATIGAPHDEWGEQVTAVILLRAEHAPSDQLAGEILDFARAHLPSYKCPKVVHFVDTLPRSEAGKILRSKVREPYWAGRLIKI